VAEADGGGDVERAPATRQTARPGHRHHRVRPQPMKSRRSRLTLTGSRA
jgi:hypothetical protein